MEENYVEPYYVTYKKIKNYLRYLSNIGKLGFIRNLGTEKETWVKVAYKNVSFIYSELLEFDNDTSWMRKVKETDYFYLSKKKFSKKNNVSIPTIVNVLLTLEQNGILEIIRKKQVNIDKKTGEKKYNQLTNNYKFYPIEEINFEHNYIEKDKNKVGFVNNEKNFIETTLSRVDNIITNPCKPDKQPSTTKQTHIKLKEYNNKINSNKKNKELNTICNTNGLQSSLANAKENKEQEMVNHFLLDKSSKVNSQTRCKETVKEGKTMRKENDIEKKYSDYLKKKYSEKGVKLKPFEKYKKFLHDNFSKEQINEITKVLNFYGHSFGEKNVKNYKSRVLFLESAIEKFGKKQSIELMTKVMEYRIKFQNRFHPYSTFICEEGFPLLAYMVSYQKSIDSQNKFENKKGVDKPKEKQEKRKTLIPTLENYKQGNSWDSHYFICPECESKIKGQEMMKNDKCTCGLKFDVKGSISKFFDKYKKVYKS